MKILALFLFWGALAAISPLLFLLVFSVVLLLRSKTRSDVPEEGEPSSSEDRRRVREWVPESYQTSLARKGIDKVVAKVVAGMMGEARPAPKKRRKGTR